MRSRNNTSNDTMYKDTADTTRITGENTIAFNINVTKMIYPSPEVNWRPNAVILVPLTSYHFGLLAAPIVHFPINAPLLFTDPNRLYPEVLQEIQRLSPTGNVVPAKVILVGPISTAVEMQLRRAEISYLRIGGNDPISAAAEAMEFRYAYPPEPADSLENIMIVPADSPVACVHAAYFSAHMGVPILYAFRDRLPDITKQKLMKYSDKNVFLIAGESMLSDMVLDEVKLISKGMVERVGGNTPAECAVNFSKYHTADGHFGWNINTRDGWSFCFGTVNDWAENLAACIFAHLAKHTPLLYVDQGRVPESTYDYVLSLNPMEEHPPKPPFMHGYILGDFNKISQQTQLELESILIKGAAGSRPGFNQLTTS